MFKGSFLLVVALLFSVFAFVLSLFNAYSASKVSVAQQPQVVETVVSVTATPSAAVKSPVKAVTPASKSAVVK